VVFHEGEVHNERMATQWNNKRELSEDADGSVTLIYCSAAIQEKPTGFPDIIIGGHKWM
jgi:hypothetical protein